MKFSELVVGTEYAIIPAWDYSSKDKKNPATVQRRNISKGKLVSLDKYEYIVFRGDSPSDPSFKPAPQGSRSVGYLVESHDWVTPNNPNPIYWVARPQDIVADYASLEVRWNEEERIEEERRKEYLAKQAEQELLQKQANEYAERIVNSCNDALRSILGSNASRIESNINNRRDNDGNYRPVATFHLDGRTMQLLIEKVLEAQDLVA